MCRLGIWAFIAVAAGTALALFSGASGGDPGGPSNANAAEDWVIESFNAGYVIRPDGVVEVTEAILVDFGDLESHGILRSIPVEYEIEGDLKHRRLVTLDIQGVFDGAAEDGANPVPYTTSRRGANLELKIGDPDREVVGRQRYQLRYLATGALNAFTEQDEFFWNATGNDWDVAIVEAGAAVRAPAIARTTCYEGPRGSTRNCNTSSMPPNGAATFNATGQLPAGSGLTIVVGMPKGVVAVPPPTLVRVKTDLEQVRDFMGLKPVPIFFAIVGGIGALGLVVRHWYAAGRDRWYGDVQYLTGQRIESTKPLFSKDTIVTEYAPPELDGRRLRPAEIGLLADEDADTLDVSATLVDLAVRGYLRIVELEKEGLFGKTDYRFERLKPADGLLLDYERTLLGALFEGRESVEMSDLKNNFYTDLAKVKAELYDQGTKHDKLFPRSPSSTRRVYAIAGFGIAFAGLVAFALLGYGIGAGVLGMPIILAGLLLAVLSHAMPRRTGLGREIFRRSMGFREYMAIAETDRQRFYEQANIFAEYLPYAMVFDCVEKWARAFEGLDSMPANNSWYASSRPFVPLAFASSVNSFSNSISTAIASTPSSSGSSGFSGGGFSGGGMGGGGGGRW